MLTILSHVDGPWLCSENELFGKQSGELQRGPGQRLHLRADRRQMTIEGIARASRRVTVAMPRHPGQRHVSAGFERGVERVGGIDLDRHAA